MLIILVFLILVVMILPAAVRLVAALFFVWLCVTYWYIGIPLTAIYFCGLFLQHKDKKRMKADGRT